MLGLFIGSFNPPTLAHLAISQEALKSVSKVVFVPVNSCEKELIDIDKRIEMLSIYIKKYHNLMIDDIMLNYAFLNYHIIDLLKNKYHNVVLIMGSDLLEKFDTFDNYLYLLQNYSFIIIEREGFKSNLIIRKKYLLYQDKFTIINNLSNISSTMAKEKLKNKENLENILDKDILEYIKKHNLY